MKHEVFTNSKNILVKGVSKKIIHVAAFLFATSAFAQELNCSVSILSPTIQGTTEKKILETLKQDIFQFMNNKKWTNDQFKTEERIECNLIIDISEKNSDDYKASIQVQLNRPAFNSSYKSLVFNYKDNDFVFRYIEYQPLEFNEGVNTSNLTSVLAYYAYYVIGLDYDTYSLEGGTPYFQKCQTIVANAQNAPEKGWKAFEGTKNRYWLTENILSPQFKPLRECNYRYHRLGFDVMAKDVAGGRSSVLEALQLLQKLYQEKPGSFNMQMFFVAKNEEIVSLFSQALPDEKSKVVTLCNEIDPANSNKYAKILGN
jgi:hypothetical protein